MLNFGAIRAQRVEMHTNNKQFSHRQTFPTQIIIFIGDNVFIFSEHWQSYQWNSIECIKFKFREHTTEWTNCVFISTLCYCCCHIIRFYEVEKSSLLCSLQFDGAVDIRGILSFHRRQHQCNLSINEALKIVGRVELEQHYQVRCRCTHRLDFIHFKRKRGWKTKSEIRDKSLQQIFVLLISEITENINV